MSLAQQVTILLITWHYHKPSGIRAQCYHLAQFAARHYDDCPGTDYQRLLGNIVLAYQRAQYGKIAKTLRSMT